MIHLYDCLLQAVVYGMSLDLHDLVDPVILSKHAWQSRNARRCASIFLWSYLESLTYGTGLTRDGFPT
jgi:hypothetical protein